MNRTTHTCFPINRVRKNSLDSRAKVSGLLSSLRGLPSLGALILERLIRRSAEGLPYGAASSATIMQSPLTTSTTYEESNMNQISYGHMNHYKYTVNENVQPTFPVNFWSWIGFELVTGGLNPVQIRSCSFFA
jgi:hypothetical protein